MTDHTINGIQTAGISHRNHVGDTEVASSKPEPAPSTERLCPPVLPLLDLSECHEPAASAPCTPRGRRLLPQIPDRDTEMSASTSKNREAMIGASSGHGQLMLEYMLMTEYNNLHKQKLPGIYVIPSALSPLIWNGVIFVRQGLYQEAVFKFNLNIPENYPLGDCPRVFFEHPVFHPVVDSKTGELDVKREFKKWRRNVNYLWQVLLYVRRIFFKIDPKCPLNQEAADLYEHNMEEFKQKVVETIRQSKEQIYQTVECNDAHTIRFTPWDDSVHEEAKSKMLTRKKSQSDMETEPHKKNGLSWMKPGTTEIFSQEDSVPV